MPCFSTWPHALIGAFIILFSGMEKIFQGAQAIADQGKWISILNGFGSQGGD
jgi:hypothetical protein